MRPATLRGLAQLERDGVAVSSARPCAQLPGEIQSFESLNQAGSKENED